MITLVDRLDNVNYAILLTGQQQDNFDLLKTKAHDFVMRCEDYSACTGAFGSLK
jgi:hypothetical protein